MERKPVNERDFVQSIERGFAVLNAFDEQHPRMAMPEVAQRTGLSRPATRRILLTLQELGYLANAGGAWFLTPLVLTLAQRYSASHSMIEWAQPLLLRLAEETQESASLATLVGTEVVYVARVQVRRILSNTVDVGSRMPTTATSTGRVLMAWREPDFLAKVIAEQGMPRLTAHTVTDPVRLADILHEVRQQGYCMVESELEMGLLAASVPVRDASGEVTAAIAYSTSLGRFTREHVETKVIPLMLDIAGELSRLLGHGSADKTPRPERDGFY
ncbi:MULTISPECIES: IclR family transcriptional regulator C-terminal domain-containing protein [Amycolatopsis]|uniref:IclR family transcriptional regulator n=1 Tax=Amycolatopsis echigonensis TaxID=2576905 RepID=A0A2N3WN88_9PSEU|nr:MULTISPECIES: IclR family transcriptional regulator C-terminal domain-containing protein [Amycolatopsis]PKV95336.1 IclR family transcriptional regulator [Amycolatopsis niigatensis]